MDPTAVSSLEPPLPGGDRAGCAAPPGLRARLPGVSLLLLALLLLPVAGSLPANKNSSPSAVNSLQGAPFVAEPEAKSVLSRKRVKRGWSINSLNLLWEMEEQQRRGAAKAHQQELHLATVCPKTCWGRFGPWSACSVRCGTSGVQYAHRNITPSGGCAVWVKEHGCPGSSMVRRPCNRKCYNGGTLRQRDCACSEAYNGTCCESVISCGDPGAPPYGYLKNFDFTYDSVVRYQCTYGYKMYGEARRRCQDDGTWAGNMPICSVVTCPRPTRLDNGWIELRNGSAFGSEAVYACVTGYFLQGHRKRLCQHTGVWSGPEPRCVDIFCPLLPEPEAGMLRLPGAKFGRTPFGGVAIYSCNYSHTIRGDRIRRCEGPGPIGIWSGQEPKCIEKTRCPSPKSSSAVNTELHCSADVETGGEVCEVVCERGFARAADAHEFIECNEDTSWTWARPNNSLPLSSCMEVMTPQISLQAESPYSVKNCAALRPQERSLLRAEFSHILAVHDICMQSVPGHDGCHVTQVESRCSDWLVQDMTSSLPSSTSSSSKSRAGSGLVSRELIMTFNLTIAQTSLRDVDCREVCVNTTSVCDSESCLDAYVMASTSLLIENVNKLKELTRQQGDKEDNSREILVSEKPTMAAGRYILFAKDAIKISDVTFRCDADTSLSRKYCAI